MAKKKLGQHFLFDKNILRKIIKTMELTKEHSIIEIGAGRGTLTEELAVSCKNVFAVELDEWLVNFLKEKFQFINNVCIIDGDILSIDINSLPVHIAIGNIPYYITTPIIFKLIESENIERFGLLMQKEVAMRIVSKEGSKDYGLLSIAAQLYTEPKISFFVKKSSFSPPPLVDSAFVVFRKKIIIKDEVKQILDVVKIAFSMRRKTLFNNLKRRFGNNTERIFEILSIERNIRPENVSIDCYKKITKLLTQL